MKEKIKTKDVFVFLICLLGINILCFLISSPSPSPKNTEPFIVNVFNYFSSNNHLIITPKQESFLSCLTPNLSSYLERFASKELSSHKEPRGEKSDRKSRHGSQDFRRVRRLLSIIENCSKVSHQLLGPIEIVSESEETLSQISQHLTLGGNYVTKECNSLTRVAIIIPYRDRESHLKLWLSHMHPFLSRQQIDYRIFVIEQRNSEFNRATLMNIGFVEALITEKNSSEKPFDCFIFHDVDLLPEDDRNLYTCSEESAKHLAVSVDKWNYRLVYPTYFGGVTALTRQQFKTINGFSNSYYGWGGEDDDLYVRVSKFNISVLRPPGNIARYKMLKHEKISEHSDSTNTYYEKGKRLQVINDGYLNVSYRVESLKEHLLYTFISVSIPEGPPSVRKNLWKLGKDLAWNGISSRINALSQSLHTKILDVIKTKSSLSQDRIYN